MKKGNRSLWVILFGIPCLLVLPLAVVGSQVYTAGSIDLDVVERGPGGSQVAMHIPAAIVPVALTLMPEVTVDGLRMDLDEEAQMALRVVHALANELESVPDGVFVDVMDGTDIVTIAKRDGKLEIYVDTPDETVRCSVPLRTVRHAIRAIGPI